MSQDEFYAAWDADGEEEEDDDADADDEDGDEDAGGGGGGGKGGVGKGKGSAPSISAVIACDLPRHLLAVVSTCWWNVCCIQLPNTIR